MSETRWWWIRHAPVTANNGCLYGNMDLSCDVSDEKTANRLAALLPREAVWVTSHLKRTRETADSVLRQRPSLAPLERLTDRQLAEQSFGEWQGISYKDLDAKRDGAWHRFWLAPAHERPPGGESFEDLVERVKQAICELNERYRGSDLIAVSHGGTIRAALAMALGLAPERALSFVVDNFSLTRIDHIAGAPGSHAQSVTESWRVEVVNFRP